MHCEHILAISLLKQLCSLPLTGYSYVFHVVAEVVIEVLVAQSKVVSSQLIAHT